MKYRREIDGLRSLAVLPVILFHAGFAAFGGGFVGVDIFFVISGYLITTIIASEMDKGEFSLLTFYERRARRILPALFFVLLCTLPFAWLWMRPLDLKGYSEGLVAVSLFASNILFYLTSGYFDTASELKPLLHTWSLAVEEQYYVLFPLFLMLTWRLGRKWVLPLLFLVASCSLLAAQWLTATQPSATFYLLPTRGFEILIGALIALRLGDENPAARFGKSVSQWASALGLALIVISIFAFDKNTPSPSIYTLVPTIGAGLILVFANKDNLTGAILGHDVFVRVGLISYSTYLWHQPLLAFGRLKSIEELSSPALGLLCASSLVLGYLSWRFVENPFRNKRTVSARKLTIWSVIFATVFIIVGLYGYRHDGVASRFPPEARLYTNVPDVPAWQTAVRSDKCNLQNNDLTTHDAICSESKRPLVALWGDSYAAALYPGLKKLQKDYQFGLSQFTGAGCPPLTEVEAMTRPNCDALNIQSRAELRAVPPDILIVHSQWTGPSYRYTLSELRTKLVDMIHKVKVDLPNTRIVLVGTLPRWRISPQNASFIFWNNHPDTPVPLRLPAILQPELDAVLRDVAKREQLQYVDPAPRLCDDAGCMTRLGDTVDSFIQFDCGHLSKAGSEFLVGKIKGELLASLPKPNAE